MTELTYKQFALLAEQNDSFLKTSSLAMSKKYKMDIEVIETYRKELKASKSYLFEPSEEDLISTDFKLEITNPVAPLGFTVNSFKKNKDGVISETWFKAVEPNDSIVENKIDWNFITDSLTKNIKTVKTNKQVNGKILSLFFGDSHIGIQIDKDSPITSTVLNFKNSLLATLSLIDEPFKEVVVVFGGDMTDSVLNESSRKGHYLPSTLTDREMFETFIEGSQVFFTSLVENPLVGKVSFYSVSEDNHTGYLAGIQSRALELWLNAKYPDIETNVFDESIGFYTKDGHTYIILHGKESRQLFKNLPLILDAKTESYLMAWCLSKGILPNYKNTHVVKFDLHQSSYQLGKFFSYLNCLSMQVGSKWQQLNFMSSSPGVTYSIQSDNGIQNGELFL